MKIDINKCIADIESKLKTNNMSISDIESFRVLSDVGDKTGMLFINFKYSDLTDEKSNDSVD